jgi:hypothetical protein
MRSPLRSAPRPVGAVRPALVLAVLVVAALLGTACGSDDGADAGEPTATTTTVTTTTPPGDDEMAPGDATEKGAGLLPGCREIGAAVANHLGEEVLDTSRSSGGGLRGNVVYSTEGCIIETDAATYRIAEHLAVDAGDGTTTDPLAFWAQTEAFAAAGAEADESAGQLVDQIEAAGGALDGALDDDGDLVVLVGGATYGVSFGMFAEPTPTERQGLAEVAVAVALAAPGTVDALCEVATAASEAAFGGPPGDPRTSAGGGTVGDIGYETESCSFELADSDLDLRVSISDQRHWEAANARVGGSLGGRPPTRPVDGVGDGAFASGDDLVVRIGDHVVAFEGTTGGERQVIPPADLVGLAAAVLEG